MNKWSAVLLCGIYFVFPAICKRCVSVVTWALECSGREPIRPADGSIRFVVYFASRYRGLCVGTMVSRSAVLTAAVCVTNPVAIVDTRPINVVLGATYRHTRRGIRVQVTKIIIPNLSTVPGERGYLMEKSAAVLVLKRKIPDVLMEFPVRPIAIDYKGETALVLQDDCLMPGWHFFYKGDTIYPVQRFLLQRNMRVQSLNIVKKALFCETLTLKFQKALKNLGFEGFIDTSSSVCIRDPEKTAMPCHGMYGAPLVCRGKVAGMLMSPDAQWTNCTGFSNMVHLLRSAWLRSFFICVSRLFEVDEEAEKDWLSMKKAMYEDASGEQYDYINTLYDRLYSQSRESDDD